MIQAPASGSGVTFLSNRGFGSNIDATFSFRHQGFGRTTVGIYSASAKQWLADASLDTNDTAYLGFASGGQSSGYTFPSAPYMNTPITIRIVIDGNQASFYANNQLMATYPFTRLVPFQLGFAVGSVSWKTGDNISDFFRVNAKL